MGPAVRRTRPQSRITAAPVEDPNYSGPKVGISGACGPTSHSKPAGNGFFGCRDKAPKTITKKGECLQRPKSGKQVAGNPRRTALFGVDCGKGGLRRLDGGGSWAQTGDPPPSHRTGLRPAPGTELSNAETGRRKPAHHLAETESETRRERESPHFRAISARRLAKV